MSFQFETFQGENARAEIPVGIDLTGKTITVEFNDNSRFEESIMTSTLTGQEGTTLALNLLANQVELLGDCYFRISVGGRVIQLGSIDYNPRPVGAGLTEAQVLELINDNGSGGQVFALAWYDLPALVAGEQKTVAVSLPYELPFNGMTWRVGIIPLATGAGPIKKNAVPKDGWNLDLTYEGFFGGAYAGGKVLVYVSVTPL